MNKPIIVCAHRGASSTAPENTIPAFAEAVALGCEMIEFDVRSTTDGTLVILHDSSVDRTTDGSGLIWELDYQEIRQLDASNAIGTFSEIQIPTLQEVLDFLPREIELNIHVYPGPEDSASIVGEVCQEVASRALYENAFVSGSDEVIKLVIDKDPKVRRCLLGSQHRPELYAQLASEMGCTNSQPLNSITTPSFCEEAHHLGLIVHPFYADDEAEMVRLIECGVDGILTNEPQRLIQVLRTLH